MKRLSGERPDKSKVEAATGEVQSFLVGSLVAAILLLILYSIYAAH